MRWKCACRCAVAVGAIAFGPATNAFAQPSSAPTTSATTVTATAPPAPAPMTAAPPAAADTVPGWLPPFLNGLVGSGVLIALAWLNNRHQRRLESDRTTAARQLEATRAEINVKVQADEKRAAAAADALLASLELLDGMEAAASVSRIMCDPERQPDEEAREQMRRTVEARWTWLQKYDDQFDRAYQLAQVYLPDTVCDALERVRKLKWSSHVGRLTHAELIGQGQAHRPDAEKFFDGGYGKGATQQITALRAELKTLLRPVAQREPT